ncbi:MAG: hypothetical protein IJQ25_10215, partial [Oscillibacter sp.]|nr:hypothetical protein [Oscillibacter sp.]
EASGSPHDPRPEASGSPHDPRPETSGSPHNPPETPHEAPHRPAPVQDGLQGFLRHLLQVSHAENVDTGDLLLLCMLFLLYREGADEELLVALGLLLIL